MTEEPEECECSICKRNKGAAQGATEPHVPMMIRSIRIDQKGHRTPILGAIQEEEPPNRGIPETGSEKTIETAKSYQGEGRGQDAKQQKSEIKD